jgi:AraC-like DNA-binding protein
MNVATIVEEHAERRHTIAHAGQRFVGRLLKPDPAAFVRAIRLLAREIPKSQSLLDKDALRKELAEYALRSAVHLHAYYHSTVAPVCGGSSHLETIAVIWGDCQIDARFVLRKWVREFLDAFAATHPWPAAVRAAMLLRKQRRRSIRLDLLCARVGASRAALTRGFRQHYGMSVAEYHRRAKLQWVLEELRRPGSNVESVSLRAGFRGLSSLRQSLRAHTGLTPTQVRCLSEDACRHLFDAELSLSSIKCLKWNSVRG